MWFATHVTKTNIQPTKAEKCWTKNTLKAHYFTEIVEFATRAANSCCLALFSHIIEYAAHFQLFSGVCRTFLDNAANLLVFTTHLQIEELFAGVCHTFLTNTANLLVFGTKFLINITIHWSFPHISENTAIQLTATALLSLFYLGYDITTIFFIFSTKNEKI